MRTADPRGQVYLPNPLEKDHPDNQGLAAWLLGLQTGGGVWYDLTGLNNNAGLVNLGATSGWDKTPNPTGMGGILLPNGAGTNDYLDWGNRPAFQTTTSLSLTCWVKRLGAGGTQSGSPGFPRIMSKLTSSSPSFNGYEIVMDGAASYAPYFQGANASNFGASSPFGAGTGLAVGTWYFLAGVADFPNKTCTMYIITDGTGAISVQQTTGITTWFANNSLDLWVGDWPGTPTNGFDGVVADVAFWSVPLSQARVEALYLNSKAGYPGRLRRLLTKCKANAAVGGKIPIDLFFRRAC